MTMVHGAEVVDTSREAMGLSACGDPPLDLPADHFRRHVFAVNIGRIRMTTFARDEAAAMTQATEHLDEVHPAGSYQLGFEDGAEVTRSATHVMHNPGLAKTIVLSPLRPHAETPQPSTSTPSRLGPLLKETWIKDPSDPEGKRYKSTGLVPNSDL